MRPPRVRGRIDALRFHGVTLKSYGKVPYKYALYKWKFESNYSATSTISVLGLVSLAVWQLAMASALVRVARKWKMVPA